MVNDTKRTILTILKKNRDWNSGEQISQTLGISRVAVWKQVKSLQEQGYPIESGHKGYIFLDEGDPLSELEFSEDSGILYFEELSSTMDEAVRQIHIQKKEKKHFLILAEHQSNGIGQNDSPWDSPSGGLYMTFLLRGPFHVSTKEQIKKTIQAAVLESLLEEGIRNISFDPEGGIYLESRKLGGFLEEYHRRGETLKWYALGLGLHLNEEISDPENMISIQEYTKEAANRASFIHRIKSHWDCYRTSSGLFYQ